VQKIQTDFLASNLTRTFKQASLDASAKRAGIDARLSDIARAEAMDRCNISRPFADIPQ
jgi:hypothetical protein